MTKKLGNLLAMVAVFAISAFLGYAWGSLGVDIENTGPWQMHPSYQGIYLQAVADAYAADSNAELARVRLSFLCQSNGGVDAAFTEAARYYPGLTNNLARLRTLYDSGVVQQDTSVLVCNTRPINQFSQFVPFAQIGLGLMGLLIVVLGVLNIARGGEEAVTTAATPSAAPAAAPGAAAPGGPERARPTLFGRKPSEPAEPRSAAAAGAQLSAAAEKTDFSRVGVEPPLVQFMTTYLHGDDLYDDSFSIDTPTGEFLGETGVDISEIIGSGPDSKKVTALEVWLFDKNDIRTVTKVLMTEHAFNDDAIRAKLAAKGEATLAKAGEKVTLETASLRVQVRVVDLAYGTGAVSPNSFFERITLELAAWKKSGQPAAPSGGMAGGISGTPSSGLPSSGLPNLGG